MNTSIRPELILVFALTGLTVFLPLVALFSRQRRSGVNTLAVALLVPSLAALGLVFFTMDSMAGISASLPFCAAFLIVAAGLSAAVSLRGRSALGLCLGVLFVAGIGVLHLVDVSPVKPFKRFYAAIDEGMTKAEVVSLLHGEFPDEGRFPVPILHSDASDCLMFVLDPSQGAYNAEAVFVTLRDGRVLAKEHSPD